MPHQDKPPGTRAASHEPDARPSAAVPTGSSSPRLLGGRGGPPTLESHPLRRPSLDLPRPTLIIGGLLGVATIVSIGALLTRGVTMPTDRAAAPKATGATSAAPIASDAAPPPRRTWTAIPGPWRIDELSKDSAVRLVSDTMERRSFIIALDGKGVPRPEIHRIMGAFRGLRDFDHCGRNDKFVVALDRGDKHVVAFEYQVSPSEVYQARADDQGNLAATKLDMHIVDSEYASAFYVTNDVSSSLKDAGFQGGILDAVDEALSGRASQEDFKPGALIKVIVTEETMLGLFSGYKGVVAAEYRPAGGGRPIKVYSFKGTQAQGYVDNDGKVFGGGWRMPIPGARVTSGYNPKRLHPVLHKVISHNGTDFGAAMGTPIRAALHGTIVRMGPLGRCGNAVEIQHPGGIMTGYCHMSRFVPGMKAGDKVATQQVVGYVGMTGSATGPHLHFFAKKGSAFFNPLSLHLDSEHPLPEADRAAFAAVQSDLDRRLDAIPLPPKFEPPAPETDPAPSGSASAPAEVSNHGTDEDAGPSTD